MPDLVQVGSDIIGRGEPWERLTILGKRMRATDTLLALLRCRFHWNTEVTRAKTLIASGEAEFELDEDAVPLVSDRSELASDL